MERSGRRPEPNESGGAFGPHDQGGRDVLKLIATIIIAAATVLAAEGAMTVCSQVTQALAKVGGL